MARSIIRAARHVWRAHSYCSTNVRDRDDLHATEASLALAARIPVELVRRVTSHVAADVVLKHYFQQESENFRKTAQATMPMMLIADSKAAYAANVTPEECLRMAGPHGHDCPRLETEARLRGRLRPTGVGLIRGGAYPV